MADFPGIAGLAEIADTRLHPAVNAWVRRPDQLEALRGNLRWEVDVAVGAPRPEPADVR